MPSQELTQAKKDIADIFTIAAKRGQKDPSFKYEDAYQLDDVTTVDSRSFRMITVPDGSVTEVKSSRGGFLEYRDSMTPAELHKLAEKLRNMPKM